MRTLRLGTVLLSILFALTALASFAPGPVVSKGMANPLIGDVNADGLTDIIHDRTVLLNQGDGTFVERDFGLRGPDPEHFDGGDVVSALIDVNGDGRPDLLTKDRPAAPRGQDPDAETYRIYIAGDGWNYGPGIVVGKGLRPYVADVDGDHKEDLVLVKAIFDGDTEIATELKVLLSVGDGTFTARTSFRIAPRAVFGLSRNLVCVDMDHDARPDLVIRTQHDLVLLRGTGSGDFAVPENRYVPDWYFGNWAMGAADFDGDGNVDIALAAFRIVRVFFNDGTGHFPRFASAVTTMLRPIPGRAPEFQGGNNPRNLGFGQFVRAGRTEIAAGTAEGDVVILAYENGALREVSRIETEFVDTYLYAGAFREPGKTDAYLTSPFTGTQAAPRLLYVEAAEPIVTTSRPSGRSRAVRGFAASTLHFDVEMHGGCVPQNTDHWSLTREGIFGVDRHGAQTVETVLENGTLYFRLTAPWARLPILGRVQQGAGGSYTGDVFVSAPCGAQMMPFTITPR
jgi:hypothetical protein